jgi:DnaJ-class molecular chaperone
MGKTNVKEEVKVPVVPVKKVEDRSSFNCPDCKGEGLKNERELCQKCLGTGKV